MIKLFKTGDLRLLYLYLPPLINPLHIMGLQQTLGRGAGLTEVRKLPNLCSFTTWKKIFFGSKMSMA